MCVCSNCAVTITSLVLVKGRPVNGSVNPEGMSGLVRFTEMPFRTTLLELVLYSLEKPVALWQKLDLSSFIFPLRVGGFRVRKGREVGIIG
ncbi:hypothetical protein V6N13_011320 [Hibiscus sabdariffa]|uniref:Uncharacterized protein n=1 Tax=Hibiscus sabdariffa TaxID=183260 RepID=A0ABR2SBV6_9ROSI